MKSKSLIRISVFLYSIIGLFLAACSHGTAPTRSTLYVAMIERVNERAGDYHSPKVGSKQLTYIFLHLKNEGADHVRLRILLLNLYTAEAYGEAGDMISFKYPDKLPSGDELLFEQLLDYRVISRDDKPPI